MPKQNLDKTLDEILVEWKQEINSCEEEEKEFRAKHPQDFPEGTPIECDRCNDLKKWMSRIETARKADM